MVKMTKDDLRRVLEKGRDVRRADWRDWGRAVDACQNDWRGKECTDQQILNVTPAQLERKVEECDARRTASARRKRRTGWAAEAAAGTKDEFDGFSLDGGGRRRARSRRRRRKTRRRKTRRGRRRRRRKTRRGRRRRR